MHIIENIPKTRLTFDYMHSRHMLMRTTDIYKVFIHNKQDFIAVNFQTVDPTKIMIDMLCGMHV